MKKLSILVLLSLHSGIFASEREIVEFNPSKGQNSVPGGSAIAMCAQEAMKKVNKGQAGMEISEVVSQKDYEEQRAAFIAQQKDIHERLIALAEQAKKTEGAQAVLEAIEKAQKTTSANVTELTSRVDIVEKQVRELIAAKSLQGGGVSPILEAEAIFKTIYLIEQSAGQKHNVANPSKYSSVIYSVVHCDRNIKSIDFLQDFGKLGIQRMQAAIKAELKK